MIVVQGLSKQFRVPVKNPDATGFLGTIAHFFRRDERVIDAVKDVSFAIAKGEIVGFLGPNGAGKTTTLKMLSGLIHPTHGTVEIAGHRPLLRKHAFLKKIALVMGQKEQLIWDLPAIDALRMNGAIYDIPSTQCALRIKALADMLGLDRELYKPIRKLSLGERMKAELLAALLHQPDVLFLDEPTLGLDVTAQNAIRQFLKTYNATYGATILLTSHYMADITALCERVMVIHQGGLLYDGGLDALAKRFLPEREVRLVFSEPVSRDVLARYGTVRSLDGLVCTLHLPREGVIDALSGMLATLPILDLHVSDPPIEDVVSELFRTGRASRLVDRVLS